MCYSVEDILLRFCNFRKKQKRAMSSFPFGPAKRAGITWNTFYAFFRLSVIANN
jgi:hypothetical protein